MAETIQAWSPTLLDTFSKCRYQAYLKAVKKIKEPERPPLPDGKEYPNDRGSRMHDEAEAVVRGTGEITRDIRAFEKELTLAHEWFQAGRVETENLWAFDSEWNSVNPTAWGEHWGRLKIDLFVHLAEHRTLVVDYKSGKRYGNELKHNEQMLCYAVAAIRRHPELDEVIVELWYFDQNELVQRQYDRMTLEKLSRGIDRRVTEVTTTTEFPPNPNRHNCFFCPYKTGLIGKAGPEGTGHCALNPV